MASGDASGRGRRFLRGLLTQLVIVLVTLAVTELVLRVLDNRFLRDGARPGYAFVYRDDPELGWAPVARPRSWATCATSAAICAETSRMRGSAG